MTDIVERLKTVDPWGKPGGQAMIRHPLYVWAEETGRTVKQACIDLGISRAALHNWDNGYQMPTPRTLSRILAVTKGAVTPNDCHRHWAAKSCAALTATPAPKKEEASPHTDRRHNVAERLFGDD